jgi:hypothetical protein
MVVSDNLFMHVLKVTTNHGSYDASKVLNEVLHRFILVSVQNTPLCGIPTSQVASYKQTAWNTDGKVCP